MANFVPDKTREKWLKGDSTVAWHTVALKLALVRGYTANVSTHEFLSDVTGNGGAIVATSAALSSKTTVGGVADAADVTFTAVPSGAACQHLVLYADTGTAATSPLIYVMDSITGLPYTPQGNDLVVTWDNTSTKIFRI
jgi:hypothetical protein